MDLVTTVTAREGAMVVTVQGDIDLATAGHLTSALEGLATSPDSRLVIDLDGVGFLDSSALAALVGANRDVLAAGGTLAVACPQDKLLKIFTITKLDEVIPIFPDVESAIAG